MFDVCLVVEKTGLPDWEFSRHIRKKIGSLGINQLNNEAFIILRKSFSSKKYIRWRGFV